MRINSQIPASALEAFGVDMAVRANNLANINTDGFKSQSVQFMSLRDNMGVTIGSISENTTPGPLVPGSIIEENPDGGERVVTGLVEGSNTDVTREIVHMSVDQVGFHANVQSMRTLDDMTGSIFSLIV